VARLTTPPDRLATLRADVSEALAAIVDIVVVRL
jgi:hypothetical protein